MRILSTWVSILSLSLFMGACADEKADSSSTAPVADAGNSSVQDAAAGAPDTASAAPDDVTVEDDAGVVLGLGPDDEFAQMGCALLEGEKSNPVAGLTAAEAGQQLIVPSHETGYAITLPESGTGFVTLEVPDWQVVIALFTLEGVEIILHDPDDKAEVVQELSYAAPCSEQQVIEERTKFHKWGGFTMELRGEPGGEVWLAAVDLPLD